MITDRYAKIQEGSESKDYKHKRITNPKSPFKLRFQCYKGLYFLSIYKRMIFACLSIITKGKLMKKKKKRKEHQ